MINTIPALWALLRFFLRYGPTALSLVEKIQDLIDTIPNNEAAHELRRNLYMTLGTKSTKKIRRTELENLYDHVVLYTKN